MVTHEEVLSEEVEESFDATIQILWSHLNTKGQHRRVPFFRGAHHYHRLRPQVRQLLERRFSGETL